MPKSNLKWVRCYVRVLRMVSELHRMGYQRLRVMPYRAPLAPRIWIGPADTFSLVNGAFSDQPEGCGAGYSAASDDHYFEWTDLAQADARTLAEAFVERFPRVCEQAQGSDWAYAGWLSDLLGVLERHPDVIPQIDLTEFSDVNPEELRFLPLVKIADAEPVTTLKDLSFPLPPRAA